MKRTGTIWDKKSRRWLTILCIGVMPIVAGGLLAGCAGDRYHESTGETIDDTATTARVKNTLGHDPQFKYDDVHVNTFKGDVQLSGFVASNDAKHHAADLVRNVDGVREVENDINVRD